MDIRTLFALIDEILAANNHRATPHFNLNKILEEAGELASEVIKEGPREAIIQESTDLTLCAMTQMAFVDAKPEEVEGAVRAKVAKAVAVAMAGGKPAWLAMGEGQRGVLMDKAISRVSAICAEQSRDGAQGDTDHG